MHYFVFQHPKHVRSRYQYSTRIKLNSFRGNFDLERIRIALKMRYEITGFGDHEIYRLLDSVDRSHHLKGHILEVEDVKDAMWIKLNYDMIGKQGTKLLGTYRNLNKEFIRETVQEIKAVRADRLRGLAQQIAGLWRRLGVPKETQQEFLEGHPGLHEASIKAVGLATRCRLDYVHACDCGCGCGDTGCRD